MTIEYKTLLLKIINVNHKIEFTFDSSSSIIHMIITRASTAEEIAGIKQLQNKNLKSNLASIEIEQQGFVTAEYSIEFLTEMNTIEPAIIAKDGDKIAGYALVATKAIIGKHDLLDGLFNSINKIKYKGQLLAETNYVLVGQLCVGKTYRGQGLVQQLYQFFKASLHQKYTYCLTDVDENNPRSVKAHLKTGFNILDTFNYGNSNWHIIIWDWSE